MDGANIFKSSNHASVKIPFAMSFEIPPLFRELYFIREQIAATKLSIRSLKSEWIEEEDPVKKRSLRSRLRANRWALQALRIQEEDQIAQIHKTFPPAMRGPFPM